ncbi:MAG: hypothetical protein K0S22_1792 [Oscillospiraceae bacterium]|jgi:hypothetical protein|nr:hypothetical protein [Oscillospiraceae bacterium]
MDKKKSILSRIIIAILCLAMLSIACFSFIYGNPPYTISDGMIYIFLVIVILLISESFETFSIGNLITLKREVKEKTNEVEKLETENRELRNQILSVISTSLNNKNNNTAFFGFDTSLAQMFRVESATKQESESKEIIEEEILDSQEVINKRERPSHINRSKIMRETEALALTKFIEGIDIKSCSFQKEVKFSEQFIGIDPIMDRNIVFDAYVKRPLDEVFLQVRYNTLSIYMDFKLYYMISKIYHYSKANKTQAKMVLIIPKLPQTCHEELFGDSMINRNPEKIFERLFENYSPAIKSGLLEITEIVITEDEFKAIENDSTM